MTTTRFPILDAQRTRDFGRVILDCHGEIEPYIEEVDSWVSMPVRLVHDQAAGMHLEIGPYSLIGSDIERLRAAIAAFDEATGRSAR